MTEKTCQRDEGQAGKIIEKEDYWHETDSEEVSPKDPDIRLMVIAASKIYRENKVALPKEVFEFLGLKDRKKILFCVNDRNEVVIVRDDDVKDFRHKP